MYVCKSMLFVAWKIEILILGLMLIIAYYLDDSTFNSKL